MIPKIIHYCWFGRNPKPEIIEKCIASWKKYCPDWEIREWNEDNFDVASVTYMKEAYEAKKWAFVSDVARLLIIYQSGGVYLDTDVELLKPIDELIYNEAFFSFETSRNINSGLGFGAIKGHKLIAAMVDYYKNKKFLVNEVPRLDPCPAGNTETLKNCYPQFIRNGQSQYLDGIRILSGKEYGKYAIHHGTCTWATETTEIIKREYRQSKIKALLRDYRCFDWIEKHFGKKALNIYTLFVYDLWEFGVSFYLRKIYKKIFKRNS